MLLLLKQNIVCYFLELQEKDCGPRTLHRHSWRFYHLGYLPSPHLSRCVERKRKPVEVRDHGEECHVDNERGT